MINNKISDKLPKSVNSETKEIIELTDEIIDNPDSRKKIIELTDVVGGTKDIGEDIIELTDIIESSAATDENIIELTDIISDPEEIIELTDIISDSEDIKPEDIKEDIIDLIDIVEPVRTTDENVIELSDIAEVSTSEEEVIDLTEEIIEEESLDDLDLTEEVEDSIEELFDEDEIIDLTQTTTESEIEDAKAAFEPLSAEAELAKLEDNDFVETTDSALPEDDEKEVSTSEEEVVDLTEELIEEESLDDLDLTEKVEDSIEELFGEDENIDLTQTTSESEIEDAKTAFEPLPAEADLAKLEDNDFVETTDSALPEDDEKEVSTSEEEVVDLTEELIEEENLDDLDLTEKVEDSIEELFDEDENVDLTQTTSESEIEDAKAAFEPLSAEADLAKLEDNDFVETTDSALPEDETYTGAPAIEEFCPAGDTKDTENIKDLENIEDTEELLMESESKAEFNPAKALEIESDTADNFEVEKITSEDQPKFVIIPEEPNGKIDDKIDDRDELPESIAQLEDVSREPELISLSEEQIEAALEKVIDKLYSDKIEDLIIDVIHKAVTKEITKIKQALLDNTDNVL